MSFPFISIKVGKVLCGCILGVLYYKILHLLEHGEVGLKTVKLLLMHFSDSVAF
jgi:hypothetical protein